MPLWLRRTIKILFALAIIYSLLLGLMVIWASTPENDIQDLRVKLGDLVFFIGLFGLVLTFNGRRKLKTAGYVMIVTYAASYYLVYIYKSIGWGG